MELFFSRPNEIRYFLLLFMFDYFLRCPSYMLSCLVAIVVAVNVFRLPFIFVVRMHVVVVMVALFCFCCFHCRTFVFIFVGSGSGSGSGGVVVAVVIVFGPCTL